MAPEAEGSMKLQLQVDSAVACAIGGGNAYMMFLKQRNAYLAKRAAVACLRNLQRIGVRIPVRYRANVLQINDGTITFHYPGRK
jgi:hypothetical protein